MSVLTKNTNSIDNLDIGWLLKGKLKSYGINTIEDLDKALDNDTLPYGKERTVEILQKALNSYKTSNRLRIVVIDKPKENNKKGRDMDIKTKKQNNYKEQPSAKPTINRYDMAGMLLDCAVELANDHDVPKYRMEKYPSFPSYDFFYDDKLIYIRFEKLEEMLDEKLKGYDIISTVSDSQKHIFMAINFLRADSPLYCNEKNGRVYCFSSYKYVLPVPYKYVRFYIDRLESQYNTKLDLSMNDDLQEEWIQEKARMDEIKESNKGLFPEVDSEFEDPVEEDEKVEIAEEVQKSWEPTLRGLAETYALNKNCEEAINVCMEYARNYISNHKSYKGIEYDVLAKLIDYKSRVKDNVIKSNAQILINDIQEDMKVTTIHIDTKTDQSIKTLESVLEKDLSKLPDDVREEISREILNEVKPEEEEKEVPDSFTFITPIPPVNIIINSCSPVYGNMVVMIFTVVVTREHTNRFDFKNQVYTGTYQFDTNNIESGLLAIDPEAGDTNTIKSQLLEMINNLK